MGWSIEKLWDAQGLGAIALAPLGCMYALGWWGYQSMYALKLKRAYGSRIPIVTVGNLIAGGAGKTPLAMHVCEILANDGHEVVLGMSGYGFPHAEGATIAPTGPLAAHQWGDEPSMVRHQAPELPLVVGRDRVLAAQLVEQSFPSCTLVMDDGFQHLRLEQRATIVLDADSQNHFCLPAGPYREPRSTGLRRASLVLPGRRFSLVPTFESSPPLEYGEPVNVVTAIARPKRLLSALDARGTPILHSRLLPDHDPMTAGTLLDGLEPDIPLVVTAKDWVKLQRHPGLGDRRMIVTRVTVAVEPRAEFRDWLLGMVHETGR